MAPSDDPTRDPRGEQPLGGALVDEILERFDLVGRPPLDAKGLRVVYSAWCRSVPFDNLQKLLALEAGATVLPGMQADDFFAAWMADGTGGTCWSSNNALHALLSALGFDAAQWSASMFDGPANHGTTIVTVDAERWIVDTAIHGDEPALIVDGETTTVEHQGYPTTIRHDDRGCLLEHPTPDPNFAVPCRILDPLDYPGAVEANERSRGWSPFNTGLMAGINDDEGVWMLKDADVARIDRSGIASQEHTTAEVDDFLVEVVGCSPTIVAAVRATL